MQKMNKNAKNVYKPLANGKGFCYNYNCVKKENRGAKQKKSREPAG
jgi:hypothetical protein